MSLPRLCGFLLTSFALSRECYGFKLFQCTLLFSPSCDTWWSIEIVNNVSMCIVIHVESTADTTFG